jgi:hypothetical protein
MPGTSLAPSPQEVREDPPVARPPYRFVTALGLAGATLLTGGTLLHPAHADAGTPAAAFAEYADASRGLWVTAHLLQLGGVAGLVLVIVLLPRAVDGTRGSAWARVTAALGFGLLTAPGGSRGLGALAVLAAKAAAVNGVTLALSGFSAATMLATTVSGALALVWMLLVAVWSWRRVLIQRP